MAKHKVFILIFTIFCVSIISSIFGCKWIKFNERKIKLSYKFTIQNVPRDVKQIAVWIPIPPTNRWQKLEKFEISFNQQYEILEEPEYKNEFLYFNISKDSIAKSGLTREVIFHVKRRAYKIKDVIDDPESTTPEILKRFLSPDRLVPIDGMIAKEAQFVAGDVQGSLNKTRAIYDHIVNTVIYRKKKQGWGRGDAVFACSHREGNCTDFHSLFIGEVRSLGIPARFVMGIPIINGKDEGAIPSYHCWAEFYIKDRGWIPVDASEASKYPEKREAFFGGLDENRVEFTMGRDIAVPKASGPPLNYFIYPYVEIDGVAHNKIDKSFYFQDL